MWEPGLDTVSVCLLTLQVKRLLKNLYGKDMVKETKNENPIFFQPKTILQTAVIVITSNNYSQYRQQ